jgi:hypothetical protein
VHARKLAAVRRGANRRLAAMLREIASLRHHEARARALERLLAERDAALAALRPPKQPTLTGSGIGETPIGDSHEQDPRSTGG